jgi:predicted DNA-binding transcriptional regulator
MITSNAPKLGFDKVGGLSPPFPPTHVKATSLKAYSDLQKTGKLGRQEAIVYYYIMANKNCTRRQIEYETRISISSVCGRVNKLIKHGKIAVKGVGI